MNSERRLATRVDVDWPAVVTPVFISVAHHFPVTRKNGTGGFTIEWHDLQAMPECLGVEQFGFSRDDRSLDIQVPIVGEDANL